MRTQWLVCATLSLTAFGDNAIRIARVPAHPLELATANRIAPAKNPQDRQAAIELLGRARSSYATKEGGVPYYLKFGFTADSGGITQHDGAWEVESFFVPGQGLRWQAHAASGYRITGITSGKRSFSEGTEQHIPLRLQEARGLLFSPLPSASFVSHEAIRTITATLNGATLSCVLLSEARTPVYPANGRMWDESEECVDAQSGRLILHSEAPGRYVVYDYTNSSQLNGRTMPSSVTLTEGSRVVSKIVVEKFEELTGAEENLLTPTEAMTSGPPAVNVTGLTKIARIHGDSTAAGALVARPVIVMGLVTAEGKLVEAHSLQPDDPNSRAAVQDALTIDFSAGVRPGSQPTQHSVIVIEKFVGPDQARQ